MGVGEEAALWRWKASRPPTPLPEPSSLAQTISSLGLQIFLLINYYASCQISIAITKRLIATMRCGTPLLQGNFLLFMLWHNVVQQSGRTTEHKFSHSPSAEEVILITAEGWQLAPAAAPRRARCNLLWRLPSNWGASGLMPTDIPHTLRITRSIPTFTCFYLLSAREE